MLFYLPSLPDSHLIAPIGSTDAELPNVAADAAIARYALLDDRQRLANAEYALSYLSKPIAQAREELPKRTGLPWISAGLIGTRYADSLPWYALQLLRFRPSGKYNRAMSMQELQSLAARARQQKGYSVPYAYNHTIWGNGTLNETVNYNTTAFHPRGLLENILGHGSSDGRSNGHRRTNTGDSAVDGIEQPHSVESTSGELFLYKHTLDKCFIRNISLKYIPGCEPQELKAADIRPLLIVAVQRSGKLLCCYCAVCSTLCVWKAVC